jgi:hypothetical protein
VVKWSQRYRATGSAAAKRMGEHRRRILLGERVWLLARIEEKPDLTHWQRSLQTALPSPDTSGQTAPSPQPAREGLSNRGITFKKKPVRRLARPPGRRPPSRPVKEVSGSS